MTSKLLESIKDALKFESVEESVTGTKTVAIKIMEEIDPSISIRSTEYFNHAFAPDLIVTWPDESSRFEKKVFLRPFSSDSYLSEDVEIVGTADSFVFSLDNLPIQKKTLDDTTRLRESMVLDPSAMESLIAQKRSNSISNMLSAITLRSGIGAISSEEVESTSSAVDNGFISARSLNSTGVLSAQDSIHGYLKEDAASEIDGYLLALWLASDGRMADFPAKHPHGSSKISDQALLNLLDLQPISDREFWLGIAKATGLQQLLGISANFTSPNLQYLIASSIDSLHCKAMGVSPELLPFLKSDAPKWKIEQGVLKLEYGELSAYFSESEEKILPFIKSEFQNFTLESVAKRIGDHAVNQIVLRGTGEELSIRALNGESAVLTDTFKRLLDANSGKFVDSAQIALNNGINVEVNYRKMTLGTKTRSTVSLLQLLSECLDLLIETPDPLREYSEKLKMNLKDEGFTETLFDLLGE